MWLIHAEIALKMVYTTQNVESIVLKFSSGELLAINPLSPAPALPLSLPPLLLPPPWRSPVNASKQIFVHTYKHTYIQSKRFVASMGPADEDAKVLKKIAELNLGQSTSAFSKFGCKNAGFVEAMVLRGTSLHRGGFELTEVSVGWVGERRRDRRKRKGGGESGTGVGQNEKV